MRAGLVACLVLFFGLEAWLVSSCLRRHGSLGDAFAAALSEPATHMMLVDFTLFGAIVFVWMIIDSKKRGKNGWLWLPLMATLPTLALALYLLARGETKDA